MANSEPNDGPDHDDWLEHIDTVVLSRELEAELDRPAETEPPERRRDERAS